MPVSLKLTPPPLFVHKLHWPKTYLPSWIQCSDEDLIKVYEVTLSRMISDILDCDLVKFHWNQLQRHLYNIHALTFICTLRQPTNLTELVWRLFHAKRRCSLFPNNWSDSSIFVYTEASNSSDGNSQNFALVLWTLTMSNGLVFLRCLFYAFNL